MSNINWHMRGKATSMFVPSNGGDFAVVELQTKNQDCELTLYFDKIVLPDAMPSERLAHARIAAAALNCKVLDVLKRAHSAALLAALPILADEIAALIMDMMPQHGPSIPKPGDDVDSLADEVEPEGAS